MFELKNLSSNCLENQRGKNLYLVVTETTMWIEVACDFLTQ